MFSFFEAKEWLIDLAILGGLTVQEAESSETLEAIALYMANNQEVDIIT